MKKKSLRILSILFLLLLFGLLLIALALRCYTVTFSPEAFTADNRQLDNPYRGWYRIYGYTLSDTEAITSEDVSAVCGSYTYEIALLEINLRNYASSEISSAGLSQLDAIFSCWQEAGKQLIVRFLYDWDGNAKETEPKDISIIQRHMEQTAALVNEYKSCIWLLQGIFVGNCGEMNNSDYMDENSMVALAEYLASVVDSSVYLSVRTPAHWRTICRSFEPLAAEDAFSGTTAARIGLFNDGMLASGNDLGTYGDTSLSLAEDYSDKGTREEELAFQDALCRYVPNGGEVVTDNVFNDFSNALDDLKTMHVSYLNCDYDQAVLEKWKSTVYEGDDCFNGCSGYDYIGEHLGYRYAFLSADCSFDTLWDDTAAMQLTIENSGFSCCYRALSPQITVVCEQTGEAFSVSVDTDTRDWGGGETVTLSIPLDIRTWQEGSYRIYFSLTDPSSGRQISFANTLISSEYGDLIATLEVGHMIQIS